MLLYSGKPTGYAYMYYKQHSNKNTEQKNVCIGLASYLDGNISS